MARISDEELERLKREVSVERLAEAMGVKLRRTGHDLMGLCPFHDDQDPSLVVTPATNLWNCLGACGKGGTAVDWVMRQHGVSFRHAVELLREDLAASPSSPGAKRSTVRMLPSPLDRDAGDDELLLQVVHFYHEALKQSPEALGYLESRGLGHSDLIEHFQLGYVNRTLGYRIPEKNREEGEAIRSRLQALGLLRETGHEHFRGSIVVPIFDEQGKVVEMYGRKVRTDLRKGTPLHLYLPGGHHGVFNLEALAASKEVILCEALLDALTFWCAGYRNVTSSYGVHGFTDEHLEALRRHGTERVLLAYDRDEAGDRAAAELAPKLLELGIDCYRVQFPHGMDANEYALKVKPAAKSFEVVLRNTIWMGNGKSPKVAVPLLAVPKLTRAPSFLVAAAKEKTSAETVLAPLAAEQPPETATTVSPTASLPKKADLPEAKNAPVRPVEQPIARDGEHLVVRIEDRTYRLRGLPEVLAFDHLHVNLLLERGSELYVERLDLYSRSQRAAFAKEAAGELHLQAEHLRQDLGLVFRLAEEHLEQRSKKRETAVPATATMTDEERAAALALLRAPDLLERILADFDRAGVVGEETNKLMGYLGVVSRKLPEPLALIVQSSSAAGKSSLMESVLAFVPPEDRVKYSAVTAQALYYRGETELKHKVLAVVEEEGAEKASYALKLLQSEGELSIASTGKDPQTGKLVTQDYHVEGPVMIFLTTTAPEVDEELVNRCIVLTVNEDREQTRAIHRRQRESETLEGLLTSERRERVIKLHQDAQRLLRSLRVVNPYARELTFLDDRTRTRRDHRKYLTLIRAIALLHQYQRPTKTLEADGRSIEYIEATLEDIAVANWVAHEILGRSLDELAPQTRRLLLLLNRMVAERTAERKLERGAVQFSRREVREYTGWGQTQLKVHLARLVELEYLCIHHAGRGVSYRYELLYDGSGQNGEPFLRGLIDVSKLAGGHEYDGTWSGQTGGWSGVGRPLVGPRSGGSRIPSNGQSPHGEAKKGAEVQYELPTAR